ncbi:hypothetical protein ACFLTZ_04495 [Chloroflexota bacterium]
MDWLALTIPSGVITTKFIVATIATAISNRMAFLTDFISHLLALTVETNPSRIRKEHQPPPY